MAINPSIKHHYLPEFYLKGFSDENGKIHLYKDKYQHISEKYPAQICYKENLHTIKHEGKQTTMIEEFYSQIEGEFSKVIELIKTGLLTLEVLKSVDEYKKIIGIIIAIQFWRLPQRIKLLDNYSKKLLELYDSSTDEQKDLLCDDRKFIKLLQNKRKNNSFKKIIQFLVLPLLTFKFTENTSDFQYFLSNENNRFLTSDSPIIYDNAEDIFLYKNFCFPLSKEIMIVNLKNKPKQINSVKLNEMILEESNDIIISSTKKQLEIIKQLQLK